MKWMLLVGIAAWATRYLLFALFFSTAVTARQSAYAEKSQVS